MQTRTLIPDPTQPANLLLSATASQVRTPLGNGIYKGSRSPSFLRFNELQPRWMLMSSGLPAEPERKTGRRAEPEPPGESGGGSAAARGSASFSRTLRWTETPRLSAETRGKMNYHVCVGRGAEPRITAALPSRTARKF